MPSHSTHHLQPLDVGVFGPYQHYYSNAVDKEVRLSHGTLDVGKHNFWPILQQARAKTFTVSTITSAWKKSGLVPFNPRVVYSLLPGEHTPEVSGSSNSPLAPSTPQTPRSVRKLTKTVIRDSAGSPQRRNAQKLSSTVEKLLVTHELMRADLLDVKKALAAKPTKHKRKLVGVGVFSLTDLKKMKEEKDKAKVKNRERKKRSSTLALATAQSQTLRSGDGGEDEEGDTIVVAVRVP